MEHQDYISNKFWEKPGRIGTTTLQTPVLRRTAFEPTATAVNGQTNLKLIKLALRVC